MAEKNRWERHLRGVASLSEVAFELQWDGEKHQIFSNPTRAPLLFNAKGQFHKNANIFLFGRRQLIFGLESV